MTDEKYCYVQDVKEKKNVARSARNARTHPGKKGSVKLPCDYLTGKELKAMSGAVQSYNLKTPMPWNTFKTMPDDLKKEYINGLRTRFGATDLKIAEMMGVTKQPLLFEVKRLGLSKGKTAGGRKKWDEEGFNAWWKGTEEIASDPVVTDTNVACKNAECDDALSDVVEEPEATQYFREDPKPQAPTHKPVVPIRGELTFNGNATDALNTAAVLLGGANVRISLLWEVIPEEVGVACE